MRRFSLVSILLLSLFVLSGCLTSQYKEYKFHFTSKTTGTLTITYRNIYSQIYKDEKADSVLSSDFASLTKDYLEGNEIEKDFPDAVVKSKRLYEENDQLCGEIILEFKDPADVHLFKYDKRSPWMFYINSDETYFDSNGEKPAQFMPIVFWNRKVKNDFELTTSVREPESTDQSLLSTWKKNRDNH